MNEAGTGPRRPRLAAMALVTTILLAGLGITTALGSSVGRVLLLPVLFLAGAWLLYDLILYDPLLPALRLPPPDQPGSGPLRRANRVLNITLFWLLVVAGLDIASGHTNLMELGMMTVALGGVLWGLVARWRRL
ncbi:MAG TPA: hypothetical protein VKY74_09740 [Chloroflexia bacterium]|nr:hypothetical protein [Chloroflexia bacterium]